MAPSRCYIINKKNSMSDNQEKRVLPPIIKPKKNIEVTPLVHQQKKTPRVRVQNYFLQQ
ncbi:hypothetical protein NIES4071_102900 (plasmid) [Calothrix sp. NIES-4071]|nr:hypothetical protein NIES4071_102900 [Calothrix sp. NIES-4071]